jgi:hypothetical protein
VAVSSRMPKVSAHTSMSARLAFRHESAGTGAPSVKSSRVCSPREFSNCTTIILSFPLTKALTRNKSGGIRLPGPVSAGLRPRAN